MALELVPLDPARLRLARRLPGLPEAVSALGASLRQNAGGRLGESAVVSTCVHLVDSGAPGEVTIVRNRDAGQVFYGRPRAGEVVHVDVFHDLGEVDHRSVAQALAEGERAWREEAADGRLPGGLPADAPHALLDFVDLQTATGGGRATGSLRFGRGEGLRRAHRNHVHLACLLPPTCLSVLPYLVAAVEEAVARTGLEVRALARVRFGEAAEGAADGEDLAPYADANDSLIRDPARMTPGAGGPSPTALADPFDAALSLAKALGGVEAARAWLEAAARGARAEELVRGRGLPPSPVAGHPGPERNGRLLAAWVRDGVLEPDGALYRLGPAGWELRAYLALHAGELAIAWRIAARHLGRTRRRGRRAWEAGPRGPRRRLEPAFRDRRRLAGQLAVAETVAAAALRRSLASAGGGPRPPAPWPRDPGVRLAPEDLRVVRRERPRPLDLVLLIDASASMAGARMRAAQELALRLLVGSRDRVAIVSFQDRGAALRVALTRNRAALARGVAGVRPCGLTPLAAALEAAVAYLRVAHARRPLLVLITDGIPTVSRTAAGPLEDALRAAEQVARARVPFTCVGLEPNKGYLVELAERAGGTLYVVEELEGATLAEIVEGERRWRRAARA